MQPNVATLPCLVRTHLPSARRNGQHCEGHCRRWLARLLPHGQGHAPESGSDFVCCAGSPSERSHASARKRAHALAFTSAAYRASLLIIPLSVLRKCSPGRSLSKQTVRRDTQLPHSEQHLMRRSPPLSLHPQFLSDRKHKMMQTPFVMNQSLMGKVAQLGDFDEQLYKVSDAPQWWALCRSEAPR